MARRRVILLVESTSAYGRRCLTGVARYARLHGHWSFWHRPRFFSDRKIVDHVAKWQGEGIISRIENKRTLEAVRELDLPVVDVRGAFRLPDVPSIVSDPSEVVRMAFDHLQSKGYPQIAYCGMPGVDYSDAREQAFAELYPQTPSLVFRDNPRRYRSSWREVDGQLKSPAMQTLQRWLSKLPKPVGVIACHDQRGRQILEACASMNLRVPYDVGVIGVDNDEVICELADPPLSSVAPHVEAVGYDAARILDEMMNGKPVDDTQRRVMPKNVQLRASTDTTAVQEEDLTGAIRYIDQHMADGVNVAEVAVHTRLSRSSLERRFREHLGCTPREYILRRRIDRIRQLLQEPNLKVSDVAHRCGFRNTSHMIALFRSRTGQTPSEYRRGIV